MGFYQPFTIIKDAQRHGLKVKPVDVTRSNWDCTIEEDRDQKSAVRGQNVEMPETQTPSAIKTRNDLESTYRSLTSDPRPLALRLGLRCVKGLRESSGRAIQSERDRGPFTSLDDLRRRVPELRKDELRKLAAVGALNFIQSVRQTSVCRDGKEAVNRTSDKLKFIVRNNNRRDALWQVERVSRQAGPLFDKLEEGSNSPLVPMNLNERLNADLRGTGITIGRHPMAHQRAWLDTLNVAPAANLKNLRHGQWVRVAGWVIVRQRPGTAKGFVFLSMEDETGIANVIVTPKLFELNRLALVDNPFLLIEGVLQHQDNVISVKAKKVEPLQMKLQSPGSHDFH
jgi:error-prone DNA polymerase